MPTLRSLDQVQFEKKACLINAKNPEFLYFSDFGSLSGANNLERATTLYSGRIVFTDRSIFSLNLTRIQTPRNLI